MHEALTWHQQTHAEKAVAALLKNHFRAVYVPSKEEAAKLILEETDPGAVVGMGVQPAHLTVMRRLRYVRVATSALHD